MRSVRLCNECLIPESYVDENTLLTDSWLNFIAARERKGKPETQKVLNSEMREKLNELCLRIEAMLEERKQFCSELQRMAQNNLAIDLSETLPFAFAAEEPPLNRSHESDVEGSCSKRGIPGVKAAISSAKPTMRFLQVFRRPSRAR
jgi:hypothetical protein